MHIGPCPAHSSAHVRQHQVELQSPSSSPVHDDMNACVGQQGNLLQGLALLQPEVGHGHYRGVVEDVQEGQGLCLQKVWRAVGAGALPGVWCIWAVHAHLQAKTSMTCLRTYVGPRLAETAGCCMVLSTASLYQ